MDVHLSEKGRKVVKFYSYILLIQKSKDNIKRLYADRLNMMSLLNILTQIN